MPSFIEPMLPTLVDDPPEGEAWTHEIKYDGYRTQLAIEDGSCRAFTRNGHDWSEKYQPIVKAAAELPCDSAILDGEIIVQDEQGRSDFHALRSAIHRHPERLVFMAFDLMHLDGKDLRKQPLSARRERLEYLLGENRPDRPLQFSDHVESSGAEFLAAVEALGLEGIVSKKITSRYSSGRAKSWLKTKAFEEDEFVVIGTSKGDRAPVALLAREADGELTYAGGAMVTLAQPDRDRFWQEIDEIRTPEPPIAMEPRKETGWAEPVMRVRAKFLRGEELLRHATLTELVATEAQPERTRRKSKTRASSAEPPLPNPKLDHSAVEDYYRRIAPLMLPWVTGRPLNLLRCSGWKCWFQRNLDHPPTTPGTFSPAIGRTPVLQKNGKTEDYLFIEDAEGLSECVAADAIEFHGWGSRVADIEKPDRLVIDLDPDEGLDFGNVREAAFEVRRAFDILELQSFALLSGGKGIHVVVPLEPGSEWPDVRNFAHQFCRTLAEDQPDRFTVALPKVKRRGRIFLDYLRNQRSSTAILPYSLRARPGAPVAAPVTWNELPDVETAAAFTIQDAAQLKRRATTKALRAWGAAKQRLPI